MAVTDISHQFYSYEGRLASFQSAQPLSKRRASSVSSKAPKAIKWPHFSLKPEGMAKAGFFHYPTQENPDNVVCFLCRKSLDGWEEDDDPLVEHLKHSPDCGWAIVASIEGRNSELSQEYPLSTKMVEARKATFGDRWPHEDKKGWKCKVKQLVDAGWKYTPTLEYDDMATCAYCELALDGWEPSDRPSDEHQKRSPDCAFFTLINSHEDANLNKKPTKTRKPRASKASRVSTQSAFTIASEAPSMVDILADEDDSIVTTATNFTVTSQAGKKMPKAKKAGKGRKTKTNNDESVEVSVLAEPEDDDFEVKVAELKGMKGNKRTSEAMEEPSTLKDSQPPAKRRGTRNTRGSVVLRDSTLVDSTVDKEDTVMTVADDTVSEKTEPKRKKGRPSAAKSKRNFSNASTASKASLRLEVPDDNEIDKALEADLERPLSDEEDDDLVVQTTRPRRESRVKKSTAASIAPIRKASRTSKVPNADHDMFTTGNVSVDEGAIEAELQAIEVEESLPLPKAKNAKVKQQRKPSAKQQAAAKRAADAAQAKTDLEAEVSPPDQVDELEVMELNGQISPKSRKGRASQKPPGRATHASAISVDNVNISALSVLDVNEDSGNETDASMASQSTVVRGGAKRRSSNLKTKGGKKGVSRNIEEIIKRQAEILAIEKTKEDPPKRKPVGRSKKVVQDEEENTTEVAQVATAAAEHLLQEPVVKTAKGRPAKLKGKNKALPDLPVEPAVKVPEEKNAQPTSSKRAPKELTPSFSPQSSDAENQPPSSKPSTNKPATQQSQDTRVSLAAGTPIMSPSKRNIVAGLQSVYPWTAVELDEILLKSPSDAQGDKENPASLLAEEMGKIKKGELTSPEKKMTVEEWILFNASLAEEKLRGECERMVGVFEKEGGRAMRVLEGIDCVE